MKRISAQAYEALREALPAITWNKRSYESFLRAALRDAPELLVGLDLNLTKRDVADQLVNCLIDHEDRYQATAVNLMLEIAAETEFRNIKLMKDADQRALRLQEAEDAVGRLRVTVAPYREAMESRTGVTERQRTNATKRAHRKQLADELAAHAPSTRRYTSQAIPMPGERHGRRCCHDCFSTSTWSHG